MHIIAIDTRINMRLQIVELSLKRVRGGVIAVVRALGMYVVHDTCSQDRTRLTA